MRGQPEPARETEATGMTNLCIETKKGLRKELTHLADMSEADGLEHGFIVCQDETIEWCQGDTCKIFMDPGLCDQKRVKGMIHTHPYTNEELEAVNKFGFGFEDVAGLAAQDMFVDAHKGATLSCAIGIKTDIKDKRVLSCVNPKTADENKLRDTMGMLNIAITPEQVVAVLKHWHEYRKTIQCQEPL